MTQNSTNKKRKLLVFHPIIALYRIDFFNILSNRFEALICMFLRQTISQKFDYKKISEQFNFTPTYLDKSYNFFFFKIKKGIISTIHQYKPDIVLVSECGYTSFLVVLYKKIFRKKYKIISLIDDSYDMVYYNNQFSRFHKYAEKILIPLFDNIISVEPDVNLFFQKKYNKGIFFPIIQDEIKLRNKYAKILDISARHIEQYHLQNKKIVLFVGRLVEIKNISLVIKAFKQLKSNDTSLVIVGSGNSETSLKSLADNNENIIFTGRLEGNELYAWYNIAELFVLPSIQEAFGAVTNEALIGGCFCLISSKAGSNCLIKNGVNGKIFDPYNEYDFYNILINSIKSTPLRKYPLQLRENKMLYTFNQCVELLLNQI